MTASALLGLGIVGSAYGFSTLPIAICLVAIDLSLDVARRRPFALRLVDIWRLAFVYLFGSEVLLSLADVRRDFGVSIASAAEGFVVAAFGASLLGYAAGELVRKRRRALPAHSAICGRRTPQVLALLVLSAAIILCLATVSGSGLLTARSMRTGDRVLGAWSVAVVAAMVVHGAMTTQCLMALRRRAVLVLPAAVAVASFGVLYLLGTRYFLGYFAGGVVFYLARFTRPLSRRQVMICVAAVLVLAAIQGTMRLARRFSATGQSTTEVASSLGEPSTYFSTEGMLRVLAWVEQKKLFEEQGRAPEHAFLLYWWVPRSVWPDKPTMDGYWLAHEVMADGDVGAGHSVAGGFALPALLDFGPYLGLAICVLYGLAIFRLERFVAAHARPVDPASVFAALVPFAVFFAMRSPQTSMIFLEACMVVYLPMYLVLRLYGRRPRRAPTRESVVARRSPARRIRMIEGSSAIGLVLVLASRSLGATDAAEPPAFAIRLENGTFRAYRPVAAGGPGPARVANDIVEATVASLGGDEWELRLVPARSAVTLVWFPWDPERVPTRPRLDDAVVYYPRLLGVAVRAASLLEWGWQGGAYPGEVFAPLVVTADRSDARMVAATNWPPRRVTPMYSLGRVGLRYDGRLEAGVAQTYRALVVRTSGDAEAPWQRALDVYKTWLKAHVQAAGLVPAPPVWMRDAHGWLNVELQNMRDWNPGAVGALWDRWRPRLPWMQFWGQMSAHSEGDRPSRSATGCCLDVPAMHPRYEPELPRLARRIARAGHVGFYARPRHPYDLLVSAGAAGRTPAFDFLHGWIERNRSDYGANAFYIDVLGHRYFGDPLHVAQLLQRDLDPATVIEYPVDIYPAAFLVSGSLGGGSWQGGPGRSPSALGREMARTTAPAFGRYLLDDRVILLGESNGDHRWWGPGAAYWTERQAFLLGAKFDVMHPTEDGRPDGPENRALALAIAARDGARWWKREPVYLDRRGIGDVPRDVDVRRFRGRDGETLLVVDNWSGTRDPHITLDGESVALPDDRLAIVVLPRSG